MTLVVHANVVGQARGEPVRLPNRRRRLSTIVARHKPRDGRRFIVSVHRCDERFYRPSDRTARERSRWSKTLVGPEDVVLITTVPLGRGVASIGLAIASIALIALAPYAAPVLAGAALFGGGAAAGGLTFAIQAGMVIGGLALGYAAQAATASKKKSANDIYSISGGGNVPKPNARRPLLYGRRWSAPPLSQKDFFTYDGDANVLVKRMTLGIGKFQIHNVRVGDALFWNETSGIQPSFQGGPASFNAAVEFLYEQPSQIAPGDMISSDSVGGQELPRPGGNPTRTPWFRLAPQGVVADAAVLNWSYPAIYRTSSEGRQVATVAGVIYWAREIDPATGNVIGPEFELYRGDEGNHSLTTTALRRTGVIRLPHEGAYEVSGANLYPEPSGFVQENRATWDSMIALKDDVRIRPQTTEVVMRIRAGKGLTVTSYSDVMVEATRIVPVWDGSAWTEQPTSKAVWAYCDLVRAVYGLDTDAVDADKALYYANLLTANDTYDGQLPEVSSFWEAASEILHPLRADPVKVGAVHSFVRDESRAEPRHVLTRRQIIRDSGGATFKTQVEGGDVIVEFDRDGDPKRPDEVRFSYGPPTRTPKRYKVAGIREGIHGLKHATWLAAVAVFRGAERKITTEWDGRLVFPGDHILSDLWFLKGKQVFGVASANGNLLTLDTDANVSTDYGYGSIRTRAGREWGILRMRGVGVRGLQLHPDDVTALGAQTGISLPNVLARDTQDPTTVVLGDLVELQKTYVARSAIPSDADHVAIEMVADDPRVWQLLDETVIAPAPVNSDGLEEPLVPQISVLHARCTRIETGIEVVWGVSTTRGARNYEADLSYDGGQTWEVLSPFGPASSGRAQMRQVDSPVSVRARAFGRTALPGDYITTTFTTVAPIVQGELIDDLSITIAKLTAQTQKEIADINALGRGALAMGQDLTAAALSTADDTLRGAIRQLTEALNGLGAAQATEATNSYLSRQVIKVGDSANFAAIEREEVARIGADDALASITTTLGVQLTLAQGNIVANATAIQGLSTHVSNIDGTLTAQSTSITQLSSRINANDLAISGQATATQQLTTRVTLTEGNILSVSQAVTVLQSTVTTQGGQIGGQATALGSLTTRTSIVEGRVDSVAQRTTALESTATTQGGQIAGQATALSQLTARTTQTEQGVSNLASDVTALYVSAYAQDAQINNLIADTGASASAVSSLTARANYTDGVLSAQATSLQALSTTVGGNTATLTTYGASIDGVKVQFGVTGYLGGGPGQEGGFVFTGVKQLDGSASYSLLLLGDFFATGSITGRALASESLITVSAQIGTLVVDNISIKNGAVSQTVADYSGGTNTSVSVNVRAGSRVLVQAFFDGASQFQFPQGITGIGVLSIRRDGTPVKDIPSSFAVSGNNDNRTVAFQAQSNLFVDTPAAGVHTYGVVTTNGGNAGGVGIIVTELSK